MSSAANAHTARLAARRRGRLRRQPAVSDGTADEPQPRPLARRRLVAQAQLGYLGILQQRYHQVEPLLTPRRGLVVQPVASARPRHDRQSAAGAFGDGVQLGAHDGAPFMRFLVMLIPG
jgi:hypothetical protein